MRVQGVAWVGVKTTSVEVSAQFFEQVLGLRLTRRDGSFATLRFAEGGALELFGPEGPDGPEQFRANKVVVGFRVEDIDAACWELRSAGVELEGQLQRNPQTGYAWQHFRGPDGLLYELTYDPTHP